MSTYIITRTTRWKVSAKSPEQALISFNVAYDGIGEHEVQDLYNFDPKDLLDNDGDTYEYLDGQNTVEEGDE